MPDELYGVDVHPRYQAGLNFLALKAQGYSFAAIKASQGDYLPIAEFVNWADRARAAQLVPGAYHWLDGRSSGATQARYFYNRVKAAGGPEGFLIQQDNEDTTSPATWTITRDWAAEWEQLSQGHPFLIYTGQWWWRPRGWDGASLTPYLWESRYLTADLDTVPDDPAAFAARIPSDWWRLRNPNPPYDYGYGGWKLATFLQFTSRGDAGGLGNNVDLNATRLTYQELLALTTGTTKEVKMLRYQFADDVPGRPPAPEVGLKVHLVDATRYRLQPAPGKYTALANRAGAGPIVMVSKADLPDGTDYATAVAALCGTLDPGELGGGAGSSCPDDETVRRIVREELDKTTWGKV